MILPRSIHASGLIKNPNILVATMDTNWLVRRKGCVYQFLCGLEFLRTASVSHIKIIKLIFYPNRNQHFLAIKCPRLRKPKYGEVYPSTCSTKKLHYGAQCAFACKKGFKLKGPSFRQCKGRGSWSGGQIMSRCIGKRIKNFSIINIALKIKKLKKNKNTHMN